MANAFAQAYIDTNIELKVEPPVSMPGGFEGRSKELRERLEVAQNRLIDYQQEHGILASDERLDTETLKINELQGQLVLTLTQNADSSSKRASAGGDTLPEVMQSGVVQSLKSDIARGEAKLQDMAGNLVAQPSSVSACRIRTGHAEAEAGRRNRRVTSAIDTAGRISRGKEGEIPRQYRDCQEAYSRSQKRSGRNRRTHAGSGNGAKGLRCHFPASQSKQPGKPDQQTNVAVLSPASEPVEPAFPKLILNIFLALFLGTLLGVGAALTLELTDRRVRSREDMEQILNLNVLAELAIK